MILETVVVGPFQCNCYILGDETSREAIVIDPGDETERIQAILKRHNLVVKTILHTHAHLDHIGGTRKLQSATNARVYLHPDDDFLFKMLPAQAALLGIRPSLAAEIDAPSMDGDGFSAGGLKLETIHTPGHTPGSLSFHLANGAGDNTFHPIADVLSAGKVESTAGIPPGRLFTGDTLFLGSIGRTDLWGGSFDDIIGSIRRRLLKLDDDTVVYPGHGPATTIGRERRTNPFITEL